MRRFLFSGMFVSSEQSSGYLPGNTNLLSPGAFQLHPALLNVLFSFLSYGPLIFNEVSITQGFKGDPANF